jgi:DNA topoisomerase-3
VTGFRGRSGKSFRARLALMQNEEGRWRVEFDEPWAREGAKPPEGDEATAEAATPGRPAADAGSGAAAEQPAAA